MKLNRKTIMLNSTIEKKLRKIQARHIKESNKSYSFSKVINDVLGFALK